VTPDPNFERPPPFEIAPFGIARQAPQIATSSLREAPATTAAIARSAADGRAYTRLRLPARGRVDAENASETPIPKWYVSPMPNEHSLIRSRTLAWALALVAAVSVGCATVRAKNAPLARVDPEAGYRPHLLMDARPVGDIAFALALSGGGTRAAALAYGVLAELRDTLVEVDGKQKRLLDELDTISSVSGGSFTAAYYGLHGDGLFEDFEERFLKRNVQRDLLLRMLLPHNVIRLILPGYNRSELAIDYYNRKIFDDATFADLAKSGQPAVQINSTDLSVGARFPFIQPQFDLLCSDLSQLDVARAVTASSAVPVAFPPIALKNYAGSCGFERPDALDGALASRKESPRRYHIAAEMNAYLDSETHRYLHLVDGGIADNLGVRGPLDNITLEGGIWQKFRELGAKDLQHLVFIVVDASTNPKRSFVSFPKPPSLGAIIGSVSSTQLHRYNFETMELLSANINEWATQLRSHGDPVKAHLINVAEFEIDDPDERAFFDAVPTSLGLDDETIDRLIAIGRRLLRNSPEFQGLVRDLNGALATEPD
jgi:NTE family protein